MPQMPVVMLPSARPTRAASTAVDGLGGQVGVVRLGVRDEVVRRGTDDEAALERVLDRVGDEPERDEVDALDGRAGEELRARARCRRRTW